MNDSNSEELQMYPCEYIYDGIKTMLIWQTSHKSRDTFKLNNDSRLIEINDDTSLKEMKEKLKDVHWDEKSTINFDKFWIYIYKLKPHKASSQEICDLILSGWNFIEDLGRTFGYERELKKLKSPILTKCYNKLFYGNNLLPMDKIYHPIWSKTEIKAIKKGLKDIWDVFIANDQIKGATSDPARQKRTGG